MPVCIQKSFFYSSLNAKELQNYIELAEDQEFIRQTLPAKNLCAFIADGSILPRESGISSRPMKASVPFTSPDSLRISINLPHKGKITGMGIPKGITLIVGGGYHGKSTLLNILGCLDTPTSGEYYLDGISVRSMGKNERSVLRNRKIGFVFQSYNLLPKTTALENVELPLMYNSSISAKERHELASKALDAVGLSERKNHKSNQMSGGQQQRVAIARALVNDPVIILADEATGNLDTRTSFEILVLFQELHARGRTIIFVTHNPELSAYSSRNIVLRDGKVISDIRNEKQASALEMLQKLPVETD